MIPYPHSSDHTHLIFASPNVYLTPILVDITLTSKYTNPRFTLEERSAPLQDTVNQLSRTLALANRFLIARLEQQGLVGIAPSHGDILVQLFAHDELPMSDLAQRIDRDPSTVTALIKKLAAAGYVTTSKLNDDKRITLVSLTPKGQQLQPAFESISNDLCEIQVRGIEENDLTTLNNVLRTMQDNFKTALEGERA